MRQLQEFAKDNFIDSFDEMTDATLLEFQKNGLFDELETGFVILKREENQDSLLYINPFLRQFIGMDSFD
ncbi:MAG: hypothetical protein J5972_06370, partial [Eubacterium sp.]|nr:hypothetical protein [Eubacterium sp.]